MIELAKAIEELKRAIWEVVESILARGLKGLNHCLRRMLWKKS